jgi:DNA-directed RNA polymerase specialized sigma24 family protein
MMGAGRSAEEAQDLVRETLLAVHLKRDTYDPDALFSWLHVEQCDRGRSQRARHRGTEWWSMVSDAGSSRPRSSRPVI